MKSIILLFMLIGVIFIAVGYVKTNEQCPPPVVEYRYIPKTFEDEQNELTPLFSVFGKMFTNASPWQNYVGYSSENNFNKIVN